MKKTTSTRLQASYTIEASVILPIFLFACVSVLIFFKALSMEWSVSVALNDAAREMSVIGAAGDEDGEDKILAASVALAEGNIAKHKGPLEFVKGGIAGFDYSASRVDEKNIRLSASYRMPMPFDFFGLGSISLTQQSVAHRWVGFDPAEGVGGDKEMVYVTKNGVAYHSSLSCSYLAPSISAVAFSEVESKRNESGHKYYPCPLCKGGGAVVFITTYGENYHSSISCSGLKRTIRCVARDEALKEGYHGCGKCAK